MQNGHEQPGVQQELRKLRAELAECKSKLKVEQKDGHAAGGEAEAGAAEAAAGGAAKETLGAKISACNEDLQYMLAWEPVDEEARKSHKECIERTRARMAKLQEQRDNELPQSSLFKKMEAEQKKVRIKLEKMDA